MQAILCALTVHGRARRAPHRAAGDAIMVIVVMVMIIAD